MQIEKSRFFALLGIFFLLLYQGCYPLHERSSRKDGMGKEYGITEGSFRHRWWNYYERGLSFADGKFWQDAESDLKEAIRQRNTDKRRARTYGLHFIDYFPHRELGIVLFEQGRIEEAETELELSYYTVKSAKAALYLDRVRKAIIEKKQLAHHAPEIIVPPPKQDPGKPFMTTIRGVASSNTFVSHITVNQQEFRVDISDRIVPFHAEVPLVPGENKIRVTATNLMGDFSETFIIVDVDNTGPVISIDDDLHDGQVPENTIYVSDDSGLSELAVNGEKIFPLNGIKEFRFPDKPISFSTNKVLIIEAKDVAGNVTIAKLPFSKMVSKLLADNSALPRGILLAQHTHPDIQIAEVSEVTYRDYAFIEGCVSDDKVVNKILVNNENVLKKPAKQHFFSKNIKLDKGKNNIVVKSFSDSEESEKSIDIERKSLLDRKEDRLKIAVSDFDINIKQYQGDNFEKIIVSIMNTIGRFQVDNVRKDEKNKNDFLLKGLIEKRPNGIEISADLLDIKANDSILNVKENKEIIDAYSENVSGPILEELAKKIHQKLSDELPLKEGMFLPDQNDSKKVKTNDANKQISINIGKKYNLKKGMKVLIYNIEAYIQGGELRDFTSPFVQATIRVVNDGVSWITLDDDSKYSSIKIDQPVVTR